MKTTVICTYCHKLSRREKRDANWRTKHNKLGGLFCNARCANKFKAAINTRPKQTKEEKAAYNREWRKRNREKLNYDAREKWKSINGSKRSAKYYENKDAIKPKQRLYDSRRRYGEFADAHVTMLILQEELLGKPLTHNNKKESKYA